MSISASRGQILQLKASIAVHFMSLTSYSGNMFCIDKTESIFPSQETEIVSRQTTFRSAYVESSRQASKEVLMTGRYCGNGRCYMPCVEETAEAGLTSIHGVSLVSGAMR